MNEEDYDQADIISSEVYDRNLVVEEKYGVRITTEYLSYDTDQYVQKLRSNNSTGDDLWQLVTQRSVDLQTPVEENLLLDMKADEYSDIFHFDQPWWVQDSVKSFTLGDHLYAASSELLLRDKGATAACFYNQTVAENHGITQLYDLVREGKWTMEEMITMCESVMGDGDGDDKISSGKDMWGIVGTRDPMYYLFNSFGQKFGEMDDAGYLEFTFGSSKSVTVMQDILSKIMYREGVYLNTHYNKNKTDETLGKVFLTDHALFSLNYLKAVLSFREMESLYGIIPMPKYDELQEDYSSLVWVHHDCLVSIPAVTADPEMSAIILEALSYESYYTVYPAFYDVVLMNRSTRDDESKEMLEIIFRTRSYDPGQYWVKAKASGRELHGQTGLMQMQENNSTDVVSTLAIFQNAIDECVKKVNEWVDQHY